MPVWQTGGECMFVCTIPYINVVYYFLSILQQISNVPTIYGFIRYTWPNRMCPHTEILRTAPANPNVHACVFVCACV